NELKSIPVRFTTCIGLGIEPEVGYSHVFENVAQLTKLGAFQGSCSLLRDMQSYRSFEEAALYIFDQQPNHPSVISSSVISAVRGEFGNYHLTKRTHGSDLRISPFMPIYWFFELPTVARLNLLLPALRLTFTIDEAWNVMQKTRASLPPRKESDLP